MLVKEIGQNMRYQIDLALKILRAHKILFMSGSGFAIDRVFRMATILNDRIGFLYEIVTFQLKNGREKVQKALGTDCISNENVSVQIVLSQKQAYYNDVNCRRLGPKKERGFPYEGKFSTQKPLPLQPPTHHQEKRRYNDGPPPTKKT